MATAMRRVSVNFAEGAFRLMESLAKRKGVSMADIIREGLSLTEWFENAQAEGARILIERDGNIREVIRR